MDHMNGPITIKNIALRVKTSLGHFGLKAQNQLAEKGVNMLLGGCC